MIRQTSEIAYKECSEDGTFGRQQRLIVVYLMSVNKAKSLREIKRGIEITTGVKLDISAVAGRVNSLKKMNPPVLVEHTMRKCSISNRLITPVMCQATAIMGRLKSPIVNFDKHGQGSFV